MKVGDIMFVNGDGLFGKLISIKNYYNFGRSDTTHVGIVSKVYKDKIEVFEAMPEGFIRNEYSKNDFVFRRPDKPLKNVRKICKKYEGTPYGKINILMHAINLFLSIAFKIKLNYSDGYIFMHCSEAVSRVLYDASSKKLDFEKEYNTKFDMITPQHIYLSKQLK